MMLSTNSILAVLALLLAVLPLFAFSTASFSFSSKSGVSNRILTPNGDNRNDTVVFTFDNPADSKVSGRIYNIRGALVANMQPHSKLDPRRYLVWDGKANGAVASNGLYIYQLESEGKVYSGTVVVIR